MTTPLPSWLENWFTANRPLIGQIGNQLEGLLLRIQEAQAKFDNSELFAQNGAMGKARYFDCVKTLAPIAEIQKCVATGGYVEVLVGVNLARAQTMRVTACGFDKVTGVILNRVGAWSESGEVAVRNPAKTIYRGVLVDRLGA